MNRFLLISIFLHLAKILTAQHQPILSQYMLNPIILNPAHTGSKGGLSTAIQYRRQWIGFSDENVTPNTLVFSLDSPLRNKKFAIGTIGVVDRFALTNNFDQLLLFSYRLFVTSSASLTLGLQAGYLYSRTDYSALEMNDDGAFNDSYSTFMLPKSGAGAMLNISKFYIGFSIPQIYFYTPKNSLGKKSIVNSNIAYLNLGYLFVVSDNFHIRPSFLYRYLDYIQAKNFDINAMVEWKKTFSIGFSYRNNNALIALAEFRLNQFSIGYAYDHSLTKIGTNGSHEILLKYIFRYGIKALDTKTFQ